MGFKAEDKQNQWERTNKQLAACQQAMEIGHDNWLVILHSFISPQHFATNKLQSAPKLLLSD